MAAQYFDRMLHPHVTPVSASVNAGGTQGTAVFTLHVAQSLCNRMNNLHGGAAALVFDVCTSTAVATVAKQGFWENAGVSRTLDCVYLRPTPQGATVTVVCHVVGAGRRLLQTRAEMRAGGPDGEVLCTCEHGKVDPMAGKGRL